MKLSVKLLSGLAFVALVAVAVIGLSNSASADVDGKIYVTNVATNLTNEPGQNIEDDGRLTTTTVFGTYKSDVISGTSARDIVTDSDKFIITVIDSDLNTTTNITSDESGAGYDATGAGTDVIDVVGAGFNTPGE
ncbi:MAG: hypothetical protein J4O05_00905, partial [Chloroflexi bacterium]|nr:hypothetical protein [Chloroflexota bacterium]